MMDAIVVVVIVLVIGLFGLTTALIWIYRQDTLKAAERKDAQNLQWGIELAQVSGVLRTTQELLEAQQASNKIILEANNNLLEANNNLTTEVSGMRQELKEVRRELKIVNERLEVMTARAEAAEDNKAG